jgi:two-component system chemotaxis response regulator CheB
MREKIRVLVADDSAFMRRCLCDILESDGDIEVIDTARDGQEAVEKVLKHRPDVVTLDINMPRMDGLTALQYIMALSPCPVIIISSLTTEGAMTTFEALELGAFDFVAKPGGTVSLGIKEIGREIVEKVKAAFLSARKPKSGRLLREKTLESRKSGPSGRGKDISAPKNVGEIIVVIGVSTGGPKTLMEILPRLPDGFPAVVLVVQHMPPGFTESFAKRLDQCCSLPVREAVDGAKLERGTITVAKGGWHLLVKRDKSSGLMASLSQEPEDALYKPSVNVTMRSVIESVEGKNIIGVLLTGMGDDGADMMVEIKRRGGFTIAESEETAIVFGMPKAAIERKGADIVAPSYKIADIIIKRVNKCVRGQDK